MRFSFLELKRESLEILKNERGMKEDDILLLDRALEHLWFKNSGEYEGTEYSQSELRSMLKDKTTPEILASSVEFLSNSKEPIRSPVAYLGKCILGGLVNGTLQYEALKKATAPPEETSDNTTFDIDDFFAAAMRKSYGDDFKF